MSRGRSIAHHQSEGIDAIQGLQERVLSLPSLQQILSIDDEEAGKISATKEQAMLARLCSAPWF
jgi:hypothetical protein